LKKRAVPNLETTPIFANLSPTLCFVLEFQTEISLPR